MMRFDLRLSASQRVLMLASVTAVACVTAASATNLVQNGDFTNETAIAGCNAPTPCNPANGNGGEISYNLNVTDWSLSNGSSTTGSDGTNSYAFWYSSGAGALAGAPGGQGTVALKSPATSSNVTGTGGGGAFVAMDPIYQNTYNQITQTLMGLTVNQTYVLSFEYAAGQQTGFNGEIDAGWNVSVGGTQIASVSKDASGPLPAFSGWFTETVDFTATSTNEVLSFLATGGDLQGVGNLPPLALLDNVSVSATTTTSVPEAPTWTLVIFALLGLGGFEYYRRRKTV